DGQTNGNDFSGWASRFDLHAGEESSTVNGHTGASVTTVATDLTELGETPAEAAAEPAPTTEPPAAASEVTEPEVARRYNYSEMTLAQLRARLRMLSLDELTALLDYEQRT